MSLRLYLTPLKNASAGQPRDRVAANIATQGLLEDSGLATERIAAENIDLRVSGQFRLGETFATKLASELESLAESAYSGVPLYDPDGTALGRQRGYYELARADVEPAHRGSEDTFEYTLDLKRKGTRKNHWRAVKTTVEDIDTDLATGADGLIGVPADDRKERWFDVREGDVLATPTDTVTAEFGAVDLFDPADAPFENPTLLYELPYDAEGDVDVRVWDDRGGDKFFERTDGTDTVRVNQWVHAYHTGYEFDGLPVVDNGRIRLRFDDETGTIEAYEYDTGADAWTQVTLGDTHVELYDADFEAIGPAEVVVRARVRDTLNNALETVLLSVQRGIDGVIVRRDPNTGAVGSSVIGRATVGTAVVGEGTILDYLAPIASAQTTDPNPAQTLLARRDT